MCTHISYESRRSSGLCTSPHPSTLRFRTTGPQGGSPEREWSWEEAPIDPGHELRRSDLVRFFFFSGDAGVFIRILYS